MFKSENSNSEIYEQVQSCSQSLSSLHAILIKHSQKHEEIDQAFCLVTRTLENIVNPIFDKNEKVLLNSISNEIEKYENISCLTKSDDFIYILKGFKIHALKTMNKELFPELNKKYNYCKIFISKWTKNLELWQKITDRLHNLIGH